MYLPLWIIKGKIFLLPPCLNGWQEGWEERCKGEPVWGRVPVGGYVLAVVVGCCFSFYYPLW